MSLNTVSEFVQGAFQAKKQILTYAEYIDEVRKRPLVHIRSAAEYLKDCFDHFGSYEVRGISGPVRRWALFDLKSVNGLGRVFGQEEVQNKIYSHLSSFARRGRSNKVLMLHGPNGTAKTSIINSIMSAMETYSNTDDGVIYTFNWVFSDHHQGEKGSLGFVTNKSDLDSLAKEDPEKLHFKIRSGLRDNPLLLIPKDKRFEVIKSFCEDLGLEVNAEHPIFEQGLSHKYHEIYNELLENYQGDWMRVLKHVQVCRTFVSKQYRACAVTIEPQRNVDAQAKALTLERDFEVPSNLKRANLHEAYGDLIDGNRGVVEYSDFFKRPLEINKYLLTTSEQGTISLASMSACLDVVLLATSNEKYLGPFKTDPDYQSFKGRLELIRVPYLRRYDLEANIYREKIESLVRGKHVAPKTIDFIGLWAVLTRLRKPMRGHYKEEDVKSLVSNLTAIDKAQLYATGAPPEYYPDQDKKTIMAALESIVSEFDNSEEEFEGQVGIEYEGRRGVSPREVAQLLSEASLSKDHECLSAIAVIEEIKKIMKDKTLYDFLRLNSARVYGTPEELLKMAESELKKWFNNEIEESVDCIDRKEYLRVFDIYICQISAWKKGIKIKNRQTGREEDVDEDFMRSVEKDLGISNGHGEFRESIIMRIASHVIEHRSSEIDHSLIFKDLIARLRKSYYKKVEAELSRIKKNILRSGHPEWAFLSVEEQCEATAAIENLKAKGWCSHCAKGMIVYLEA